AITVSAQTTTLTERDGLELLGNPTAGPYVEITVMDNGHGLTPEAWRSVLLEPFFSTKPRHHGIGLALVYRILHSYRGGLRLDSEPGRGTQAHVFLPLALGLAPVAADHADLAPSNGSERVLVVDDDPLIRQLMCTRLEKAGYDGTGAGDGVQA